jgi:putative ABC transport system permease protein
MSGSTDATATTQAIAAHPDTERVVALGGGEVTVPGLGTVTFVGYDGDASWLGFELIRGRWFAGRGEAVAPTNFFRQSGLDVGDTIDLGGPGTVTLVGEIFDIPEEAPDGLLLRGAWADVHAADPGARLDRWEIQPRQGVASGDFRDALSTTLGADVALYTIDAPQEDAEFLLFLSVVTFMGVVLVAISLGGVFNTVLLETRQRTREMAVLKALGMSPAQVVAMVLASVVPVGLVAGLLGVPLGLALQRAVIAYMAEVAGAPPFQRAPSRSFAPAAFIGLSLAGLGIALAGAYLPPNEQRGPRSPRSSRRNSGFVRFPSLGPRRRRRPLRSAAQRDTGTLIRTR